uniref:Helicase C-terminal domain-containing protein n=1 Tax=Physcomitrium patens TaxID=3218 RepID=A0A7I4EHA5_PHYPA
MGVSSKRKTNSHDGFEEPIGSNFDNPIRVLLSNMRPELAARRPTRSRAGKHVIRHRTRRASADNFKDQIRKWPGGEVKDYEIKKYISFANKLKRLDDNQVMSSFSNRVMIMDEIYNLKHSMSDLDAETVYGQMWRLSHLARNYKILLLSVTPMIDKAEEILSILNLILDVDHQFDTSFFPTEDDFRRSIMVIEEGVTLEGCSVKVVPSYMDGYQLEAYKKIDTNNLDDNVYRNSIYCSLMTFWDGTYGAEAFTKIVRIKQDNKIKYTLNEEVIQRLRRDNLHLYSCKYSKMLDIIESNKDMLAFVFCEEVKGTGLIMMSCIFELFGYQLYDGENIDEIEKGLRYTLYSGDTVACSNPEKRLDGFRSPKNKYGEYVKILLGSRISGESVSLTNVRQVHIVTPHWNKSTIVRAIGRAVRSRSHDLLKAEERYVALAGKSNKYVPSVSIDMYKYLISEEKSKRIEDVENVIRSCCIDYYLNVDTTTVRSGFGDDISTYLLWYCNDIEASVREIVTRSTEALLIGAISTLLSTKKSVLKALIGKGISLNNGTRIKEIKGMVYIDSITASNRNTHLSSFKQHVNVSVNYFMKKVHLLESVILSGNRNASLFFENSFDCINNKYYHILSYRIAEDNYSYSLSSESFKACTKTRVLDGTWTTVSAEDELDIIQKIISKSKRSREIMETKHKIYAIFSNGDNRFRIRNSLSENKERSLKDLRSINRGRCIDSHSGSMMMDILLYLLTYKTKQESIMDIIGPMFYNFSDQENLISTKKMHTTKAFIDSKYDSLLLLPYNVKQKLYGWIIIRTKKELADIMIKILTENDMYIIN